MVWEYMKILRNIATLFLLLGILLEPAWQPALAQTAVWSQPLELSSPKQSSTFPEISVDRTGQVHVFWSSGIGDYDVVMYRSLAPGKGWTQENDIVALSVTSGRIITRPASLITPDGVLYLLFRNFTLFYSSVPVVEASNAGAWSERKEINSGDNVVYFSRMVQDHKGTLHLFYTENTPSASCSICFHLYYRRSEDGGARWTGPVRISDPNNGVAKPQIFIDALDKIHVVYEAGPGGDLGAVETESDVAYVSSGDGGNTWTEPAIFRGSAKPETLVTPSAKQTPTATPTAVGLISSKNIAIAQDGRGRLIVAWLSIPEDIIYFSTSSDSGKTWSLGRPITGVWGGWTVYNARTDGYSMATDSAGEVHLVLSGRTAKDQKTLNLLHVAWNGEEWSAPEVIKAYQGDVPEWPKIAVGNGNTLHVVWFERDKQHIFESGTGLYTIWYAQGLLNAPAVKGDPYPTLTAKPLPTEISSADVQPTKTPEPTLPALQTNPTQPGMTGISQPAYSETDYLVLLGKTLVPSLFFLVLVVLGIVILRRR